MTYSTAAEIQIGERNYNKSGPMRMTKAVAPVMTAQGRIVDISSVAGLAPTGSSIAYAVAVAVAPGLLEGTRATANLRSEQIVNSAASSLRKKAADKDDCADMAVTMTGQTAVTDAGPVFH